jgi:hypothetical protein
MIKLVVAFHNVGNAPSNVSVPDDENACISSSFIHHIFIVMVYGIAWTIGTHAHCCRQDDYDETTKIHGVIVLSVFIMKSLNFS